MLSTREPRLSANAIEAPEISLSSPCRGKEDTNK
jgi:hypothetical protein